MQKFNIDGETITNDTYGLNAPIFWGDKSTLRCHPLSLAHRRFAEEKSCFSSSTVARHWLCNSWNCDAVNRYVRVRKI